MGYQSSIGWTDHTFNPWIGCAKVSAGCKHCYAETLMDTRYGRVEWGVNGTRVRTSNANWRKPLAWQREAEAKGIRYRVFCASLADVFEDRPELAQWRNDLFNLIVRTPNLIWLLLTKRTDFMYDWLSSSAWWVNATPENVALGVSIENQETADERIPQLLRCPAAYRFLSIEPLLEPVDLERWIGDMDCGSCRERFFGDECPKCGADSIIDDCVGLAEFAVDPYPNVDWAIVGGESGRSARPFKIEWARDLVSQCRTGDVPVFVKQLGSLPVIDEDATLEGWPEHVRRDIARATNRRVTYRPAHPDAITLRDSKGEDWNEWPADLRLRQHPFNLIAEAA